MATINKDGKSIEDVMLDLETCGTDPGCIVLSIGACTFDERNKFYERISVDSSRVYLCEDIETMRWWQKQDRQMREEAFGGTKDLVQVLDAFHDWFRNLNNKQYKDTYVWGNGADFDLPILKAAYKAVDRPVPWHPWNGRCYRTLKNLLSGVKAPPRASVKHHALEDAIYQAAHARLLLEVL